MEPNKVARLFGTCRCGTSDVEYCYGRGGCDEFWGAVRDYERPRTYTATEKQIGFMRSLVAKKLLTDENTIARLARIEELLAEGKGVNGHAVSAVIDHAKTCADKPKSPKVTVTVESNGEEASAKQRGFIKSLVAKKQVTADIEAQVADALADKRKASALIGTLLALPDKVVANS